MQDSNKTTDNRYQSRFDAGIVTFGRLFTTWMDTNRWSHPVMTNLARCALDGCSWLHSSQISAIRHATLRSPGPRTFIAIAELNRCMHEYATRKRLIPNTTTDQHYLQGFAITENGEPPEVGWWVEVFSGIRVPTEVALDQTFLHDDDAAEFSDKWGRYMRRLIAQAGYDLIEDAPRVIGLHYPARDESRVDSLTAVLFGKKRWTRDEAHNELPALVAFSSDLGGPKTETDLVDALG